MDDDRIPSEKYDGNENLIPLPDDYQGYMTTAPIERYSDVKTIITDSVNKKKSLTGPAYKNYKPWRDTSKAEAVVVNTSGHERQKLTGPAYKNYKPWRKKAK